MDKLLILVIIVFAFLLSCSQDTVDYDSTLDNSLLQAIEKYSPDGTVEYYILPHDNNLEDIPQDSRNQIDDNKFELGKMLFFETAFSTQSKRPEGFQTYSCASCHLPESAFRPNRIQGIADGGIGFGSTGQDRSQHQDYDDTELDIQSAHPLSLINVAFVKNTFWNGQFGGSDANIGTEHLWTHDDGTEHNHLGFEAIETQNFEGLQVHRMLYTKETIEQYGYKSLFDNSFPELDSSTRYSNHAAALALSAYIRCIISDKAPFQDWLKGDSQALSQDEKEGAILFFGKANCKSCHYDKNLGSIEFHALGVKDMDQNPLSINSSPDDKRNLGRGGFTQDPNDNYKFKVPGLYNISDAAFYFHGASMSDLEEVIRYKANALRENIRVSQLDLSEKLHKIELTDKEVNQLTLFLSKSLKDPDMLRYKPTEVLSGFCFPNNDPQSRADIGCN